MGKRKARALAEDEYKAERALAIAAAAAGKAVDGIVWDHEQQLVIVRSRYPSSDNKHRTGIGFAFTEKDGVFTVTAAAGQDVLLEPLPITEYHRLAKEEPVRWLKEQLVLAGEPEPFGNNQLALAGYLTRLRQLPPEIDKEVVTAEEWENLVALRNRQLLRLKWSQRLAQIPGLTNDEYLLLACEKLPPSRQTLRLTRELQARGDSMSDDPAVAAELEAKAAAKKPATAPAKKAEKASSAPSPQKKDGKETEMPATATATKMAPKVSPKAKGKLKAVKAPKAAKPKRDKSSLINMKKHFKQGMKVKYIGKNKEFFNKTVEVLYPEKDPSVGVMIKFPGDKRQSVSPTSLSK